MDKSKLVLVAAALVAACLGVAVGTFGAKQMASINKDYVTLKSGQEVYQEPSVLANKIAARVGGKEKLLVAEKIDFKKLDKNSPTIIQMKKTQHVQDESSQKQYRLSGGLCYKVVANDGDSRTLEVTTDKHQVVKLKVNKSDTVAVDEGVWKKLQRNKNDIGWIKE